MLAFDGGAFSFRNRIINGDGNIAQRSSSASLTGVVSYLAQDRWAARQTGTPNAAIYKNTTVVPTGFSSCIQLYRPSGSTATGVLELLQAVESVNSISLQGSSVTLSFYAKAGATFSASGSNIGATLFTSTGTDQGAASMGGWTGTTQPISATQTITTTWTRYTFTGTVPANATQVGIYIYWTPVGTAGADDGLYITGVQLEAGPSATPFERRPYAVELAMCQRYYWRLPSATVGQNLGMGFCETTTRARPFFYLPVAMRGIPTIGYSAAGDFTLRGTTTNVTCNSITAVGLTNQTFAIEANTATAHGGVAGGCASFNALFTTSWIDAAIEL